MSEPYREGLLRCPACAGLLEPRDAGEGEIVDVCPSCAGVWIDWLDGDPSTLARGLAPLGGALAPSDGAHGAPCPRCSHALSEERYGGAGPRVLRCVDCAGAFVPRSSYDALAALEPPEHEEPAPPTEPEGLAWLVALLRRWLAPGA
jgi:Zn-finger nucleic acid-binding protein